MQVYVKIILHRVPFTVLSITDDNVVFPDIQYYDSLGIKPDETCIVQNNFENVNKSKFLKYTTNALFLRPFIKWLQSDVYRTKVIINLNKLCGYFAHRPAYLKLVLEPPDLEIIDYAWNDRLLRLIWMRVEIENAFSWLSTLGGAYSALGDYFEHCAEEAGRISIRQYKLSIMLGDMALAARSKLYSALSISQKGRLRTARHIVRNVNDFALSTKDKRLNRMCQGVWAKLKYLRSLQTVKQGSKGDGNHVHGISNT